MKQFNTWTSDSTHVDYIIDYTELDSRYSQLHLHELDTKSIARYGKKITLGKDDKLHTSPLYICTEIYCAFDIETSTIYGKNIINGKEGYYSTMYLAQFGINNHVVLFRKWEHVLLFFQKLPRLLGLSHNTCLLTWVHNLDYENSYIKHRFNIDMTTYFGKNKQHPIKYLLQNHFWFHDSFSVTNSSLLKLGQMYGTAHQKALGDLDHNITRNSSTVLTDTEIGYAANDVLVLCDFSKIIIETFFKQKGYIPDTATQILSKELQENALRYAEDFLGKKSYEKALASCTDEKQEKYTILKRIHGKIYGFEYTTPGGAVRHIDGIVDSKFFTPFDENEKQIPPEGKLIHGRYYYDFYEWLYRGGYTKSNARYTSTDTVRTEGVENVHGFDYTSSYPFVQTICTYPMSAFRSWNGDPDSLKLEYGADDFEKRRYIFIIRFKNIRSINDFALESLSKARVTGVKIIDNGRIRGADYMTVCLTDCDYALYKMYYTWTDKEVLSAWVADAGPLPKYLLYTLWDNGLKKQTLKGIEEMQVEYMLAKGKFNSAYGLCCKQPVYTEYKLGNELTATGYNTIEKVNYKYFGRSDILGHSLSTMGEAYTEDTDECNVSQFEESTQSSILSPFWGIWVSAFARYNLLSCVKRISDNCPMIDDTRHINDVIYMDTDSLYMLNGMEHMHIINDWNKFAYSRVTAVLPQEYKPLYKLGQFDNVALDDSHGYSDSFQRFKTLGAKRYIKQYTTTRKGKHIKSIYTKQAVTVAGLPKGTLQRYCNKHHLNIFDEFKNDLDFAIDGEPELVKLARTYHDELVKINVKGEIMTEYSSCTLYPNTFKVKMKDIYYALLNDVLEGSGAKAYARGVKNE